MQVRAAVILSVVRKKLLESRHENASKSGVRKDVPVRVGPGAPSRSSSQQTAEANAQLGWAESDNGAVKHYVELMDTITVTIQEDPEARVWYVAESSLPGLNVEAESYEALRAQLPLAIQDLLAAGNDGTDRFNVPVELIARAQLLVGARS